jgi:hypothetical protein
LTDNNSYLDILNIKCLFTNVSNSSTSVTGYSSFKRDDETKDANWKISIPGSYLTSIIPKTEDIIVDADGVIYQIKSPKEDPFTAVHQFWVK